ncbi:hypothetical protein ACROYT_G013543 [Oculina patagonica]
MVIILALTSVFSFDKLFRRSSCWTLMTLIIYFILLISLTACCGNLTPRAVVWGESYKRTNETTLLGARGYDETFQPFKLALLLGLSQRAEETSPDQGPHQRRAENANTDYLRSTVFNVKLTETVLLFVAWVCIVNYFEFAILEGSKKYYGDFYVACTWCTWPEEYLKADFFQGVTILCWGGRSEVFWVEKGCALRKITRSPKVPDYEIQGAQHKAYMKEIRLSGRPKTKGHSSAAAMSKQSKKCRQQGRKGEGLTKGALALDHVEKLEQAERSS